MRPAARPDAGAVPGPEADASSSSRWPASCCARSRNRLQFLVDVGLDYLTLGRPAPTLSGGESQRIRLASQIGSGLTGVLYVLDEPTIGLHPRDNRRLLGALQHLRDLGNTLILVEHDREVIAAADYLLDFGPGAGDRGGEITAARHAETGAARQGVADRAIPLREEVDPGADAIAASVATPAMQSLHAIAATPPAASDRQGRPPAQPARTSTWPFRSARSSP